MTGKRSQTIGLDDTKSVGFCLLSGVLMFAAFPPSQFGTLAFVCLGPWLWAVQGCRSVRAACFASACFGGSFGLCATAWLRLACNPPAQEWGPYWWAWPLLSAIIAACYSLGGGLLWWLVHRGGLGFCFATPLGVVCAESLLDGTARWFGSTTADVVRLGLTQADIPVIRAIAQLAGLAGVSAWVAMVNGCLVDVFARRCVRAETAWHHSKRMPLTAGILVLGAAWWALGSERHGRFISVGILPGSFDRYDDRLSRLAAQRPQLCVWPELACSVHMTTGDQEMLTHVARLVDSPILVGATRVEGQPLRVFNSMICVAPNGQRIGTYDKQWLGPCEETWLPITAMWSTDRHSSHEQFSAGNACQRLTMPDNTTVCVGICHDVCFTEWSRQAARESSDFLVVGADEQIDPSGRLSHLMLALTQFRAVESHRSIVRVSRPSLSGVIDFRGTFVSQSSGELGTSVVEVPITSVPSIRWSWGPCVFWLAMLFPCGWQLFRRINCGYERTPTDPITYQRLLTRST